MNPLSNKQLYLIKGLFLFEYKTNCLPLPQSILIDAAYLNLKFYLMKKILPVLVLACIFSTQLFAQTLTINKARPASQKSKQNSSNFADNTTLNEEKCGFAQWMKLAKQRGYDESAYETELKKLIQNKIAKGISSFTGLVTIPVIFHLVHRTADAVSDVSPNLSAAKIQAWTA